MSISLTHPVRISYAPPCSASEAVPKEVRMGYEGETEMAQVLFFYPCNLHHLRVKNLFSAFETALICKNTVLKIFI